MEDWLAGYKDTCRYNLGESGMPDMRLGELLSRCGEAPDILSDIVLKDNDTRGTERLRNAICNSYGGNVPFDHITATTGTSEALFILFNLLLEKRKAAVVPMPSFQALYEVPRAIGAELRFYRVNDDTGWLPDPEEITSLIDDSVGIVVVNTPHNPSGRCVPPEVMASIAEAASRHGAVVISDEHYRFLPHNNSSHPLPTFARPDGSIIATGSITKCFGAIGLRMGWIAATPALIARVRDFRDYVTHTLSPVSDFLAALVLEHSPAFIGPAVEVLIENAGALTRFCSEIEGLSLVAPDAGVVAFPRFAFPVSSERFTRELIDRYGVFVLPGSSFETEGHFRINLGAQPDLFREALDYIGRLCVELERNR